MTTFALGFLAGAVTIGILWAVWYNYHKRARKTVLEELQAQLEEKTHPHADRLPQREMRPLRMRPRR